MNRLVKPSRVAFLLIMLLLLIAVYLVFLYELQIIQGEAYYNASNELDTDERPVTAARGNILDRYGRVLVSNKECYNLSIDTTKLFSDEDPNGTILELISLVQQYGDSYVDDLPITTAPPFEYTDMTDIQATMLKAYFKDKAKEGLSEDTTAVELLSYMRTRYGIDNNYSAEEAERLCIKEKCRDRDAR